MRRSEQNRGKERSIDPEDLAEQYFADITRIPLLTEAQEREVAKRIEQGDEEARNILVQSNLRLAWHIAKKYQDRGVALMDLIQEANMGLVRAAEKYDYRRARFTTYATYWVHQRLRRRVPILEKTIYMPIHMIQAIGTFNKLINNCAKDHIDPEATLTESATSIEKEGETMDRKTFKECQKAVRLLHGSSLDESSEDEGNTLGDMMADTHTKTPGQTMMELERQAKLEEQMKKLTHRERYILHLRFGLTGDEARTLEEVGKSLKITRERVRQIEIKAIQKLQRWMRVAMGEHAEQ